MSQAKPASTRIQRDALYEELWKNAGHAPGPEVRDTVRRSRAGMPPP